MGISLAALGVNPDRLYHGQPSTAGVTLYTAPGSVGSGARSSVTSVAISNPSTNSIAVRLGLIPQGASNDGTHYLLGDQLIPANTTLMLEPGLFLRPGDVLHGTSGSLPAPTGLVAAASASGGTLAAGTYYYVVTGVNSNGETVASGEVSTTTTGSTGSVTLTWNRSLGVTSYKLYRGTASGGEQILTTIASGSTTSYTDTGTATSAGSAPTTGTAGGCIFTICGAELPA